jgi:hypothetical protein
MGHWSMCHGYIEAKKIKIIFIGQGLRIKSKKAKEKKENK